MSVQGTLCRLQFEAIKLLSFYYNSDQDLNPKSVFHSNTVMRMRIIQIQLPKIMRIRIRKLEFKIQLLSEFFSQNTVMVVYHRKPRYLAGGFFYIFK
jgi:hypothetical protein